MTPLSLMESLPEIARRIDRGEPILLGLDFDGTLTPICLHPDDARLAASVRDLLVRLAAIPRVTVMIVSGRSLADVASRVGLPDLIYAGNHGLEIQGRALAFLEPTATALVDSMAKLATQLKTQLANIPDALVEPKGLTASVHYRNVSPNLRDEVDRIVSQVMASDLDRFVLNPGHQVWEIRPRVSWHKGQAIHWVLQHLVEPAQRLVFYLGDDRTDEDAFACLPDGVTIKVGRVQISTHARYQVAAPDAVERFLNWLADRIRPEPEPEKVSGTVV